jgi:hypothetical protein
MEDRIEHRNGSCRTLSEAELDGVSGGTSGMIYAAVYAIRNHVDSYYDKVQSNGGTKYTRIW